METLQIYDSNVDVLTLDSIPEEGDLLFNLGNPDYAMVVKESKVSIDYDKLNPEISHTLAQRAGIGVLENGKTILVEVNGGLGVTAKQLANIMVKLGARYAVHTEIAVIRTYNLISQEQAEEIVCEVGRDCEDPACVKEHFDEEVKPKKAKKKADKHE